MSAWTKPTVRRAQLAGAYARRQALEQRGQDLTEVDDRIAELEKLLDADMIAEARRLSVRSDRGAF